MPMNPKDNIRTATPEELDAYMRRTGGGNGGGDDHKESLVDGWTHSMRNEAKKILRRVDQHHTDLFNCIAKGGIRGAISAYRVLHDPSLCKDI